MNTKDELIKILINNAQSWNKEESQDRALIYVDDFLNEVESKFKLLPIHNIVRKSERLVCPHCKSKNVTKWSDNELTCYDCRMHLEN